MIPFITELKKLNLTLGQYALFGSAVLAARNIRAAKDLDIIVKKELWEKLINRYSDYLQTEPACLKIGPLEIYQDWQDLSDRVNEMIDTADIIDGFPVVKVKYFIEWKKTMNRPLDKTDLKLLAEYQKNK